MISSLIPKTSIAESWIQQNTQHSIVQYLVHAVDITGPVNKCKYVRDILSHVVNKPLHATELLKQWYDSATTASH